MIFVSTWNFLFHPLNCFNCQLCHLVGPTRWWISIYLSTLVIHFPPFHFAFCLVWPLLRKIFNLMEFHWDPCLKLRTSLHHGAFQNWGLSALPIKYLREMQSGLEKGQTEVEGKVISLSVQACPACGNDHGEKIIQKCSAVGQWEA